MANKKKKSKKVVEEAAEETSEASPKKKTSKKAGKKEKKVAVKKTKAEPEATPKKSKKASKKAGKKAAPKEKAEKPKKAKAPAKSRDVVELSSKQAKLLSRIDDIDEAYNTERNVLIKELAEGLEAQSFKHPKTGKVVNIFLRGKVGVLRRAKGSKKK